MSNDQYAGHGGRFRVNPKTGEREPWPEEDLKPAQAEPVPVKPAAEAVSQPVKTATKPAPAAGNE